MKLDLVSRPGKMFSILTCLFYLIICTTVFPIDSHGMDLNDVKKQGVLRHLGIYYANFVTGSGDGMDVELIKLFAKHLGVKYEFVKTDWDQIYGDLSGNKVKKSNGDNVAFVGEAPIRGDLIANGLTVLNWRKKVLDYSDPTFINQVWVIARMDLPIAPIKSSGNISRDIRAVKKLLKNYTLIGKSDTCLDPSLYALEKTGAKIILFKRSLSELVPAIINKEADLTLIDVPDAMVALQKYPGQFKIIGPVSEIQDMAVGFRKDSPELRKAFNIFLQKCKTDGTFNRLVGKYYPYVFKYYPEFFEKKKGSVQ